MPDAPIGQTARIGLNKYGEHADPGAAALNADLDKLDAAIAAAQDDGPLDLGYFRRLGVLPATEVVLGARDPADVNAVWPAHDFTNVPPGDDTKFHVVENGVRHFASSAAARSFGWDLLALKSRVLISFGMWVDTNTVQRFGLFVAKDAPPPATGAGLPDGVPTSAYFGVYRSSIGAFQIIKTDDAGSFTDLVDDIHKDEFNTPDEGGNSFHAAGGGVMQWYGMTLLFDGDAHEITLWVRYAPGTWVKVCTVSDADFDQVRYVGFYTDAVGVGGSPYFRVAGPVRVREGAAA